MHTHLSHSPSLSLTLPHSLSHTTHLAPKDVMKFFCMFLELKDLVTAKAFRVSMPSSTFIHTGTG